MTTEEQFSYAVWLSGLTRGELLDQILEVEEKLRNLVRGVLGSAGGLEWEKLIPATVRAELATVHHGQAKPGTDLLDAANLKQLIDIVLARWNHFSDLLKDKTKFAARADEFREWRNRLAHGANPSEDEKIEIGVLLRQVGAQIPVYSGAPWRPPLGSGVSVAGARLLWVDDHPEWSLGERQILRALGIRVFAALANDEALDLAKNTQFDLVISDIDRGGAESGVALPRRLHTLGISTPILFYVGAVDPDRDPPEGSEAITADPAVLIRDTLMLLSNTG
jgi:CheY-like chemotaxis protein